MTRTFSTRVKRKALRRSREVVSPITAALLNQRNARSKHSLLGDIPAVVSLTTYGERLAQVHLTIESIGLGHARPRRIILWLDDAEAFETLTPQLVRLRHRGLEVRLTDNLGPHTKYFPTLPLLAPDERLITADDDILYPRTWLRRLWDASLQRPDDIHCMRAHVVGIEAGQIAPYSRWSECWGAGGHPRVFATGVSGVVYPPRMARALLARGRDFLQHSPRADDIWLHAVAVEEQIPVWQVSGAAEHYAVAPATQHLGLMHDNVHQSANDAQVRATYGPALVGQLTAAGPYSG